MMKRWLGVCLFPALLAAADPLFVNESARRIPVNYQVDVVVVGGSTGAVAAAVAAAQGGAKVFLLAPRPYLGEDMCATMRLWLEPNETPSQPLAKALFADRAPLRPMHVKKTLDDALLAAGVPFVYSSFATEILRDAEGRPAGIVMANRAGRQAVLAKVIIDATPRAAVARIAGAKAQPYPAGPQVFRRVVIGGDLKSGEGVTGRKTGMVYRGDGTAQSMKDSAAPAVEILEYTLRIPMADGSDASFARAEQIARDLTVSGTEKAATEELFQIPPDPIQGVKSGAGALDLDAFRPAGVNYMYVLGGAADIVRSQAEKVVRPVALMELGARIGKAAAQSAKARPEPRDVAVGGLRGAPAEPGDVKETLAGVRPALRNLGSVPSPDRAVRVLGSYDVIVAGGGTAGAPAAIAASRGKARTLVLEYLHGMGGVGTQGMISRYWWGNRYGFSKEVPGYWERMSITNPQYAWEPLKKAEWLRRTSRQAGADVWFGFVVCGAYVDRGRVKGVVVAGPSGRGVVLAKTVVDATGNSDVAAPAGAQVVTTGANEIAQQGVGLPPINLGSRYTNSDFALTDETDLLDIWHLLVYTKRTTADYHSSPSQKYSEAFDMAQLVDSRERRRVAGDFELSLADQLSGRTFNDTIAVGFSNFDSHGYAVDPLFLVVQPGNYEGIQANLPYRCLLPKGLEGLLVAGIGVSVQRDALPALRMQADIENQGYAAGLAAAMAAKAGSVRAVKVQELQKQLTDAGIAPLSILKEKESFPLSDDKVEKAAADPGNLRNLAILMSHPETTSRVLRKAYRETADKERKTAYAMILAVLGDASGIPLVLDEFVAGGGAEGKDMVAQVGKHGTAYDKMAMAMAHTRDPRVVAPLLKRAARLDANSAAVHHRAIQLAFELLGDKSAVDVLAAVLSKPGITGHVVKDVQEAQKGSLTGRGLSLREIGYARVLYRLGDKDGLAKRILTEYTQDLRGHFSRHARAVLEEKR